MDLTNEFAKIDAYVFKYNQKAQELYGGERGVDDNSHVGVMAQELAENPITENAVIEDENGYLELDTNKLVMALTAVVSDLCKKIGELEFDVKMLKGEA